uniref:Uncharacterized protein n=1 Tax=Romanomermis culicivorax TaxID=13658 RepID=A0A915I5N8_ROMCU
MKFYRIVLCIVVQIYVAMSEKCVPMHSKAWGIELTCCGPQAHLPETCDYHGRNFTLHNCPSTLTVPCSCVITLYMENIDCDPDAPTAIWIDHYRLLQTII